MFNLPAFSSAFITCFLHKNRPIDSLFRSDSGEIWLIYFKCIDSNGTTFADADIRIKHCIDIFTDEITKSIVLKNDYKAVLIPRPVTFDGHTLNFGTLCLCDDVANHKPVMISFLSTTNIALVMYHIDNELLMVSMDIKEKAFCIIFKIELRTS